MFSGKPVRTPFPCITRHRIEAVIVRREGINRACSGVPVIPSIELWEFPLPNVAEMPAVWAEFVAPRVELLNESTPGRELPFCFSGKPSTGPLRVREGIIPGDVNYW